MLGQKERDQLELFMAGSLRQLIPDDHVLVRVDAVLDLSWLRGEIADLYCPDNGRLGIDPEVAVRLMLAGFLLGIVHDRRLMREAAVNIAIRWFVGYGVHEALPDHFSLTRIRQRWGAQRFRQIFERTVQACIAAKIATGEVVHIDASLIRAHVTWEALAVRHIEAVAEADDEELRDGRQGGTLKKVCVTDPDATMATNGRNRRLEPAYKQHTAVDDLAGVIVDVEVATGQENEGMAVAGRLDAIVATTGKSIAIATMDAGYAYPIVHLLRHSLDFVSYKDRRAVAAALKDIYRAVDAKAGEAALAAFEDGLWGRRYPAIAQSWRRAWSEVIPFYAFPDQVRRILYTTNAIEALNSKLRRAVHARGHFPNDEAAMKLLFLVLNRSEKEWKMGPREWIMAKAQFAVLFGERFTRAMAA